jgi:hypothetical protein
MRLILSLFFGSLILNSCSILTVKKCDWTFITKVGGIKSEEPFLTNDDWYLPITCDISGLSKITNEPTIQNSALECSEIHFSKTDTSIFVTVYRGLIGSKTNDCKCRTIKIGKLKSSKYKVFYKFDKESHLIGSFDLSIIHKKH